MVYPDTPEESECSEEEGLARGKSEFSVPINPSDQTIFKENVTEKGNSRFKRTKSGRRKFTDANRRIGNIDKAIGDTIQNYDAVFLVVSKHL